MIECFKITCHRGVVKVVERDAVFEFVWFDYDVTLNEIEILVAFGLHRDVDCAIGEKETTVLDPCARAAACEAM